jgi:hypothetical protein
LRSSTPPRGAVLIAGLAVVALLAVMMTLIARSALISADKARSVALADAAAKSVATWYAQVLNYDAYTNRAIAANEIMMAQAVTMTAWTQYALQISQNTSYLATVLPPIQPVAQWIQQVAAVTHELAKTGAQIEVPLRSTYTKALQTSQALMHAAATPFAAQALVNEVIWTGDRRFFGQLIPSSDISAFFKFSKNFTAQERVDLATLIRDSQDAYSKQRNFNQRLYLLPTVTCIPTDTDQAFSRLVRRGGTWASANMRDWESADTLSIHTWRRRSSWDPRCNRTRETIPLGWGAAEATLNGRNGIATNQADLRANSTAFSRARAGAVAIPGYLGLSSHRELSEVSLEARRNAVVRVPVLVRLPLNKVPKITAGRSRIPEQDSVPLGGAIWSLAVAETYFLRPADTLNDSNTREFANLFAPFWQSRLVATSAADKAMAIALAQARSGQ